MRVQSITWMDPARTRDTLSVSGLVLQVIRRLLLLHQFTRTLSETTESGFTEWWYQPTPIETRFLVPTRSACMLRMWLDHLLPHHLLNSSFLLLPLKRYWDSTPTILRANHPFYSNPSHQPSPPMPPGTRLFFGSQMPEIIQVFISSDIEVEVEFTFISESEFSVQKFKTQHKYFRRPYEFDDSESIWLQIITLSRSSLSLSSAPFVILYCPQILWTIGHLLHCTRQTRTCFLIVLPHSYIYPFPSSTIRPSSTH